MSYYYESKPDTQHYHYVNHKAGPFVTSHFHSAIELIMVRRGQMLATVNGKDWIIEAGQGCFIDKFSLHAYSELEPQTEVYAFVGNSAIFDGIFSDLGGIPPTLFSFADFDLLDQIVSHYRETRDEPLQRTLFQGAVRLILAVIVCQNGVCSVAIRQGTSPICDILRYISEHCTEDLSLSSLSSKFGYSAPYFSKLFHQYTHVNLNEYINVARVNRAKQMLEEEPDKTVLQVAFACGFSSATSFYRAYKKVFGALPKG